ncbi:MAG: S-layer homology domain-containing protein [Candidatus Gracilibacteria bacterium]|nr:S-layer homology domain-containing protein [Candidatus Gracilibacteria bacterium]
MKNKKTISMFWSIVPIRKLMALLASFILVFNSLGWMANMIPNAEASTIDPGSMAAPSTVVVGANSTVSINASIFNLNTCVISLINQAASNFGLTAANGVASAGGVFVPPQGSELGRVQYTNNTNAITSGNTTFTLDTTTVMGPFPRVFTLQASVFDCNPGGFTDLGTFMLTVNEPNPSPTLDGTVAGVVSASANHPNTGDPNLVLTVPLSASDVGGTIVGSDPAPGVGACGPGVDLIHNTPGFGQDTETFSVTTTFLPNESGTRTCVLKVSDGNTDSNTVTVSLTALDADPTISFSPSQLSSSDVGPTAVTLQITNTDDPGQMFTLTSTLGGGLTTVVGFDGADGPQVFDGGGSFTQALNISNPDKQSGSITYDLGGGVSTTLAVVGGGGNPNRFSSRSVNNSCEDLKKRIRQEDDINTRRELQKELEQCPGYEAPPAEGTPKSSAPEETPPKPEAETTPRTGCPETYEELVRLFAVNRNLACKCMETISQQLNQEMVLALTLGNYKQAFKVQNQLAVVQSLANKCALDPSVDEPGTVTTHAGIIHKEGCYSTDCPFDELKKLFEIFNEYLTPQCDYRQLNYGYAQQVQRALEAVGISSKAALASKIQILAATCNANIVGSNPEECVIESPTCPEDELLPEGDEDTPLPPNDPQDDPTPPWEPVPVPPYETPPEFYGEIFDEDLEDYDFPSEPRDTVANPTNPGGKFGFLFFPLAQKTKQVYIGNTVDGEKAPDSIMKDKDREGVVNKAPFVVPAPAPAPPPLPAPPSALAPDIVNMLEEGSFDYFQIVVNGEAAKGGGGGAGAFAGGGAGIVKPFIKPDGQPPAPAAGPAGSFTVLAQLDLNGDGQYVDYMLPPDKAYLDPSDPAQKRKTRIVRENQRIFGAGFGVHEVRFYIPKGSDLRRKHGFYGRFTVSSELLKPFAVIPVNDMDDPDRPNLLVGRFWPVRAGLGNSKNQTPHGEHSTFLFNTWKKPEDPSLLEYPSEPRPGTATPEYYAAAGGSAEFGFDASQLPFYKIKNGEFHLGYPSGLNPQDRDNVDLDFEKEPDYGEQDGDINGLSRRPEFSQVPISLLRENESEQLSCFNVVFTSYRKGVIYFNMMMDTDLSGTYDGKREIEEGDEWLVRNYPVVFGKNDSVFKVETICLKLNEERIGRTNLERLKNFASGADKGFYGRLMFTRVPAVVMSTWDGDSSAFRVGRLIGGEAETYQFKIDPENNGNNDDFITIDFDDPAGPNGTTGTTGGTTSGTSGGVNITGTSGTSGGGGTSVINFDGTNGSGSTSGGSGGGVDAGAVSGGSNGTSGSTASGSTGSSGGNNSGTSGSGVSNGTTGSTSTSGSTGGSANGTTSSGSTGTTGGSTGSTGGASAGTSGSTSASGSTGGSANGTTSSGSTGTTGGSTGNTGGSSVGTSGSGSTGGSGGNATSGGPTGTGGGGTTGFSGSGLDCSAKITGLQNGVVARLYNSPNTIVSDTTQGSVPFTGEQRILFTKGTEPIMAGFVNACDPGMNGVRMDRDDIRGTWVDDTIGKFTVIGKTIYAKDNEFDFMVVKPNAIGFVDEEKSRFPYFTYQRMGTEAALAGLDMGPGNHRSEDIPEAPVSADGKPVELILINGVLFWEVEGVKGTALSGGSNPSGGGTSGGGTTSGTTGSASTGTTGSGSTGGATSSGSTGTTGSGSTGTSGGSTASTGGSSSGTSGSGSTGASGGSTSGSTGSGATSGTTGSGSSGTTTSTGTTGGSTGSGSTGGSSSGTSGSASTTGTTGSGGSTGGVTGGSSGSSSSTGSTGGTSGGGATGTTSGSGTTGGSTGTTGTGSTGGSGGSGGGGGGPRFDNGQPRDFPYDDGAGIAEDNYTLAPSEKALLKGCIHPENSESFEDITGHRDESAIITLNNYGLSRGIRPGKYAPNEHLNRAELVKFVLESNCISPSEEITEKPFLDTEIDAWFTPWISKAKELGIVDGDGVLRPGAALSIGVDVYNLPAIDQGKTSFRPWDPVNRSEFLKIMFEAAGIDFSNPGTASRQYRDVEKGVWFDKYVAYALENDVYVSKKQNMFHGPQLSIRSDAAEVMIFLLQKLKILESVL